MAARDGKDIGKVLVLILLAALVFGCVKNQPVKNEEPLIIENRQPDDLNPLTSPYEHQLNQISSNFTDIVWNISVSENASAIFIINADHPPRAEPIQFGTPAHEDQNGIYIRFSENNNFPFRSEKFKEWLFPYLNKIGKETNTTIRIIVFSENSNWLLVNVDYPNFEMNVLAPLVLNKTKEIPNVEEAQFLYIPMVG